jgi:hypothetical protein
MTFASPSRLPARTRTYMVGEMATSKPPDRHQGRATGHLVLSTLHTKCAGTDAPRRHGREAVRDRDFGQPDHRALARDCSSARPRRLPPTLLKGFRRSREASRSMAPVVPVPTATKPRGHLPGCCHKHGPHHRGRRQCPHSGQPKGCGTCAAGLKRSGGMTSLEEVNRVVKFCRTLQHGPG